MFHSHPISPSPGKTQLCASSFADSENLHPVLRYGVNPFSKKPGLVETPRTGAAHKFPAAFRHTDFGVKAKASRRRFPKWASKPGRNPPPPNVKRHQGNHRHSAQIEANVLSRSGPKLRHHRPKSPRPRQPDTVSKMAAECPPEHQDGEHHKVGTIKGQAAQPPQKRGSETRSQSGGSSGRAGGPRQDGADPAETLCAVPVRHIHLPAACRAKSLPRSRRLIPVFGTESRPFRA